MRRAALSLALGLVAACGGESKPPDSAGSPAAAPGTTQATGPADSLVLSAPGGVQVWFTLAREGKAADGTACTDRTLEIRRGDSRVPVPLLYTGTAPELVNDSTIRARLSNECRPGDSYLVDLKTGRPVRER